MKFSKKGTDIPVAKLLLELFVVFVGVFLGLLSTNWNNEYELKKNVEKAKLQIDKEIYDNCKTIAVESAHSYNCFKSLVYAVDSMPEGVILFDYSGFTGISFSNQSATVWETVQKTNLISNVDYTKLIELNNIYYKTTLLNKSIDNILIALNNPNIYKAEEQNSTVRSLVFLYGNYFTWSLELYNAQLNYLRQNRVAEFKADSSFIPTIDSLKKVIRKENINFRKREAKKQPD